MTAALLLRYWQLVLGALVATTLVVLLTVRTHQRDDARDELKATQAALSETIGNYKLAAEQASRSQAQNIARVQAEQQSITEKVSHDYQAQLADARARADALRVRLASSTHSSGAHEAGVPQASTAPSGPDAAPAQNGFSVEDRLIATEQAIQLQALQQWVREQAAVSTSHPNTQGR